MEWYFLITWKNYSFLLKHRCTFCFRGPNRASRYVPSPRRSLLLLLLLLPLDSLGTRSKTALGATPVKDHHVSSSFSSSSLLTRRSNWWKSVRLPDQPFRNYRYSRNYFFSLFSFLRYRSCFLRYFLLNYILLRLPPLSVPHLFALAFRFLSTCTYRSARLFLKSVQISANSTPTSTLR